MTAKNRPDEDARRRSICLVANYPNRGTHMMGTAVDISVFHLDLLDCAN